MPNQAMLILASIAVCFVIGIAVMGGFVMYVMNRDNARIKNEVDEVMRCQDE